MPVGSKAARLLVPVANGNTAMPLKDKITRFSVPNAEAAVVFLQAAKKAAEAGELDQLFQSTKRTRKAKTAA